MLISVVQLDWFFVCLYDNLKLGYGRKFFLTALAIYSFPSPLPVLPPPMTPALPTVIRWPSVHVVPGFTVWP